MRTTRIARPVENPPGRLGRGTWSLERLEARTLLSAGALDPSFGTNGQLAVRFPGGTAITVVRDSLVQPDGKVVVTGEAPDPTNTTVGASDFAIARLNPDGTPDLTFNNGQGIFVFHSPGNVDEGSGVAMQSDGKLVVSATFNGSTADGTNVSLYAVGRFNADGTLDTGFGEGGAIVVDFSTGAANTALSHAGDVLVGADDKITLIGYSAPDPSQAVVEVALARLNADGTADDTFGTGGKVLASVNGDAELAFSGAFDAGGDILVTGTSITPGATVAHLFTARFLPSGAVDTTFGSNGAVTTDFVGATDAATLAAGDAVAVQPDGSIVVGGTAAHADASGGYTLHAALARYFEDGTVDVDFGDDGGKVESDLGPFTSYNKLSVDTEGRILASGLSAPTVTAVTAHQFSALVAQYTPDGFLDPTFGTNGAVTIDVNGIAAAAPTASSSAAPSTVRAAGADGLSALAVASRAIGLDAAVVVPAADAGTTTAQQAQGVFEKEAAIAVALGNGKLLVVASANDQLTASRLIGNGADLSAGAVSGVKVFSVLGGAKAAIAVPVTNVGNEALGKTTVTVTVLVSADATPDANDATVASKQFAAAVKAGAGKTFKLKFAYPAGLPDGAYFVLAVADAGPADVNAADNAAAAAGGPVTIAKPFVHLDAAFGAVPNLVAGGKARIPLTLQDAGNVPAKGAAEATFYLSPDPVAGGGNDVAVGPPARVVANVKQGATKSVKVPLLLSAGLTPGTYYLIAVLDDSGVLLSDVASVVAVSAAQVAVN